MMNMSFFRFPEMVHDFCEDVIEDNWLTIVYNASIFDWQGTSAGLKNFLKVFAKFNLSINLISYNYYSEKTSIKRYVLKNNINIIDININKKYPNWIKPVFMIFSGLLLPSQVKKSKIILSEMSIMPALPSAFHSLILKRDLVLHYIDIEPYPIPSLIYKFIMKKSKTVLAISPLLIEKASEFGAKSIIYLPPLVDSDLFKIDYKKRIEFRKQYKFNDDDFVIGYAGSFAHEEGLTILLSAMRILLNLDYKIKLLILGGPKLTTNSSYMCYDDDIINLIKKLNLEKYVEIIKPKPHDEVPHYLSMCDLTCCPKLDTEINRVANPIKVVEYLSMGIPTVCSAVGGIIDSVDNCVNGYLFEPGNISELEQLLKKIINNYDEAKIISQRGREKAINEFSFFAFEKILKNVFIY